MANSQKFTLTFDAQLNVNQMKGALSSIQSELSKLKLPANISKGFQDTLEKLNSEVKNFENISAGGINSKNDLTKLEASANKVLTLYEKLQSQAKGLRNLSSSQLEKLFPEGVAKNIEAARAALKGYADSAKAATKDLEKANAAVEKINNSIATEQGKATVTTGQYKQISEDLKAAETEVDTYKQKIEELTAKQKQMETDLAAPKKSSKYRDLIKELDEVKQKYEEASQKVKELSTQKASVTTNEKQAEALAKLNGQLTEAQQKASAAAEALHQIESVEPGGGVQQLIQIIGKLTGLDMSKFSNDVNGAAQALQTYLSNALNDTTGNLRNFNQVIEQNHAPAQQMKTDTDECTIANQRLEDSFQEVQAVKKRIQYFFGLSNAINLVKRAIRDAFDTIKELDKAMTETAVVTDFDVSDMWAQLPEYTKRANELGVTTLAAYQAATLYYQQGLKTNEVNALSVETLKMARIAGLDAAEATDRMTNALRGFNMELTEANAQRVDDVYSELAANTASNVDEISTAMTKVASLAHNANMEFETTAAFLAQIIETTRESAETAGTALKTVVARFSEVKKLVSEGELRGTDEEGQAIDVNKVGAALRTAGIDLNKYFLGEVGLDDIFMELASKWDTLTSVQQRYIATQAAGSRQQSRFIAMMQDYARTQELVGKAYNANGASARQFEKTQESLESKLNRLKNAWNEFLMGLTNNVVVKTFVDLLTDLLNNINKFTSSIEASTGSLGKWAASWGVAITAISAGKALFRDKGLLDGILGMFVGSTKEKGGLLKNILGKRSTRIEAFDTFMPGAKVGLEEGLLGRLGTSLASKGIGKGLANTKFASGLASMLGFGSAAGGGAAAGGAGAAAAAGLATALGAVAVAAGAAAIAYKAWYEYSPEGQLKQATKYAAAMEDVAKKAANAVSEIKNVQSQYENYTKQINEAQTSDDRHQAILERNKYINELLQQDVRYAQYIESVVNEEGQFVLQFKEGELEKVTKAAEAGVARAQIGADFAQAMASGKAANITQNRIEEYLKENGIIKNADGTFTQKREITDSFGGKIGEESIELSNNSSLIAEYYNLKVKAAEKEAEASAIALKAYQELISNLQQMGDIEFDEELGAVGNTLAQSLAEQYDPEQYFKIVKSQQQAITASGEALRDEYFRQFGTWADSSMKDSDIRRDIAIARVEAAQEFVAAERAQRVSEFATRGKEQEKLIQALTGEKEFLEGSEISELLNKDNKELIRELGDIYSWTPEQLGQHIVKAQEAANARRRTASATYYEQLLRAGIMPTSQQQEKIYKDENIEQKANITSNFGNLGSLNQYQDFLTNLIDISDKQVLDQLEKFTTSFDLTDPIKAFQQLKQAEEEAGNNPYLQNLIAKVREVNKELLSTPSLLRAFSETDEFEDLSKSLSDIVKENGKITPESLEELAKSSTSLRTILDSAKGQAQGLAEALTLVAEGKIGIDQIDNALITALNTGKDFKQILIDVENWIKNFNKGTDFKDGINHFKESLTELGELAKNWEFGNEITENLYNHLFGPKAYEELLAQYKDNFPALEKAITADVEKYTRWAEDYGLEGYRVFQAQSDKATFSGTTGQWDLSKYETTQQAINDVAKALGVSEGAAKSFITLWTTRSVELKKAWDNLSADEQFDSLIENLGNLNSISEDTIRTLADKWGIEYKEALARIQSKINESKFKVPIVPSFTDENGQPKSPEEIVQQINKALQESGTKNADFSVFETFHPWGNDEIDEIFRGYDPNKFINYIQSIGGSYEDAITYLNNSGKQLAQAIQVWDKNANNGQGGLIDKIITGANYDELQTNIQNELQASNYAQQAQAMANGIAKPIGEAVANALKKVFGNDYQVSLSNAGNEAAASSLWNAIQSYLNGHPFTPSITSFSDAPDSSGGTGTGTGGGGHAMGGIVKSRASGSNREISPGWALTGEEGPEIVWNKNGGYAYITGSNGPEFLNLQPGDRIFSAPETRRIFRNTSFAKGGIYPSYANPSTESTIWWKKKEVKKRKGGGGGGSSSDSKDAKKESTWRNELDWLYDLMEDIAEYERQQTIIQDRYDLYLKDITKTGRDLYNLTNKELSNLKTQLKGQQTVLTKRTQEMGELQTIINSKGFGRYLQYNQKDKTLEIDWDAIEKITDKEKYDELTDLISRAEDIQGKMDDAEKSIWDIKKQIQDLQNRYLQKYLDFQSRVQEAVVAKYQKQIDNLSELNDTLNDTNSKILDSIQKEIDLERQIRDNTDTENEIADLESRLAYLMRDTTGANAQEIRDIQKQIEEARENYSDTLIDQAVDRLSQMNEDSATQREQQVELMQAQLDYWQETGALWGEVAKLIETGFNANGSIIRGSELERILRDKDEWKALSNAQKDNWANELILETNEVGAHILQLTQGVKASAETIRASISGLKGKLGGTPEHSYTAEKVEEKYATGGLNTYTGLAHLDGTPSEPEYVLNARQTDAFLRLADVLPAAMNGTGTISNTYGGNVNLNLTMNIDEIGSDYDVDRLANRVKEIIYNASSYRNVNTLNFIR